MRVRVPLPLRSRERAYGGASDEEIVAAIRGAEKYEVPLSLLRTMQRTVSSSRVAQYEAEPAMQSEGGSPIVVEREGRYYLRNGNHRATAAIRRGDRTIQARVAHLGTLEPIRFRDYGHEGDLLLIDPRAMAATHRPREVEDVAELVGDVAVLCIEGPTESKPGGSWWSYFDDYESILCRFRSAIESDDVRSVLLKIDSPGGSAAGLNECVDAMIRCKRESKKPVYAYVDEGAYSAAYAIACVADEIYLPRAGGVGSIGVISRLVDWTEANKKDGIRVEVITSGARKADFNPDVPISGAAIARLQKRVMGLAKIYWQLVKETRGVAAKKLEADTFYGKDAVKVGLADGVLSLDEVLDSMSQARSSLAQHGTAQRGTPPPERSMSQILALTAAVKAATEALAKASSKHKDTTAAALALAEAALSRELAKVTKDKKTVTHVHESESESSSSSSSSSSESESESESEHAGSSESEEAESESEKSEQAVLAMARRMTGKTSLREVLGALEALGDTATVGPKAAKQLAKLTAERATRQVEDLIAAGKASHKITPGNEAKARKLAAKHGHRALSAFIDAAMPAIDPREVVEAEEIEGVTITSEQKKIWTKLGHKEEDFPKLAKAVQKEQQRLAGGGLPPRGGL